MPTLCHTNLLLPYIARRTVCYSLWYV